MWAVCPPNSASAHAMLFINSHQPFFGTGQWYESHVHSDEGWNASGASFFGSPFPTIGHNEFLGWSHTVNAPDIVEAIARRHRISRGTVVLCIRSGLDTALQELPRSGNPRQLTDDAKTWVRNCACQKPKDLGYSYELWTYKLLRAHVREHCTSAGHPALQKLSRSKVHRILHEGELRPHKIRYCVERRDLDTVPQRFVFVFTPTHGSSLNLGENLFSKHDAQHASRDGVPGLVKS